MNGDLSEMLKKIIENPEFAGMVSELRGDGDPDGASREMLEKLPGVMELVKPMLESSGEKTENSDSQKEKEQQTAKRYDKVRAEKLMSALKPYLSPNRCQIVDKCVSVLQIGDVMNVLGGLDGLIKRE
ncbi:MAG: hypothetical protein IKI93_15365 [Clostridia bacterium]|nr:hypothetical protein [Clostridia bacterium]